MKEESESQPTAHVTHQLGCKEEDQTNNPKEILSNQRGEVTEPTNHSRRRKRIIIICW